MTANQRLADAIYLWAFASLSASPGARLFYDTHRAAGDTHHAALRALWNRLVGILHGCLDHHKAYDEVMPGATVPNNFLRPLDIYSRGMSIGPAASSCVAKSTSTPKRPSACGHCSPWAIPGAEVAIAYRVKERLREFYRTRDLDEATQMLKELEQHCRRRTMPPEIQRLGRTLHAWFDKIANFHLARVSNGPTEALNNLIKRIKRIGFGFRNFENYRIRAQLYAGKPNWRVLGSIVVR